MGQPLLSFYNGFFFFWSILVIGFMRNRVFSMKHVDPSIPIFKFKKTFKPARMQSGVARKRLILLKI
jgi:hypothetical protein